MPAPKPQGKGTGLQSGAEPEEGAGQESKEIPAPAAPQTNPQQAAASLSDVEFVAKAAAGDR